jgi:hypothetical protein
MRVELGIIDNKQASAVISQMRIVDSKRLIDRVGYIEKEKFEITRKAIKDLL